MATLSTYLANALLNHSNGVSAYPFPTVWAALVTTTSSPSGPGAEATYTGYTRVPVAGLIGSAASGSAPNSGIITFPVCTGGTNTIVGTATFDALTGGNMLKFAPLQTPLAVSTGVVLPSPSAASSSLILLATIDTT